jgi:hypothetical protein
MWVVMMLVVVVVMSVMPFRAMCLRSLIIGVWMEQVRIFPSLGFVPFWNGWKQHRRTGYRYRHPRHPHDWLPRPKLLDGALCRNQGTAFIQDGHDSVMRRTVLIGLYVVT